MMRLSLDNLGLTTPVKGVDWVERRLRRLVFSQSMRYLEHLRAPTDSAHLVQYGSDYGGRVIDEMIARETISPDDYVLSGGAGEDITFDIEIQRNYDCHVIIVDPTSRASKHFEGLVRAARQGGRFPINGSETDFYDLSGVDIGKIHFAPFALWSEDTTLRLWAPRYPEHVSHSIMNRRATFHVSKTFIDAPARTVAHILSDYKIKNLPLLKLDIMGSECSVLKSMIEADILPRQITVKFYELASPGGDTFAKMKPVIDLMNSKGYSLSKLDRVVNCLFLRLTG